MQPDYNLMLSSGKRHCINKKKAKPGVGWWFKVIKMQLSLLKPPFNQSESLYKKYQPLHTHKYMSKLILKVYLKHDTI